MSNPFVLAYSLELITINVPGAACTHIVAGGAGNGAEIVGLTIDRMSPDTYGDGPTFWNAVPLGACFWVYYEAALSSGATLSLGGVLLQHSADGATWTTLYDQTGVTAFNPGGWPAGVVDTGASGGSTQRGCVGYDVSLTSCLRYIRFCFVPTLSAVATDTCNLTVVATLCGMDEVQPANIGVTAGAITVAPGPVSALADQSVTSSGATITWSAPGTGTGPFTYLVEQSTNGGATYVTLSASGASPFAISGLSASETVTIRVTASNAAGSGTPSTVTFTTGAAGGTGTGDDSGTLFFGPGIT